eukprot:Transcript_28233.p6 GENE.Transcript_28233~~Transcript_28233.p6  ORF type:complete len:194 (-),score=65.94 Transcript_28233:129-710(-)
MPAALRAALWQHSEEEHAGLARVRGLGWALAPPGADPQQLHADIWGVASRVGPKRDRVRFPHVLWKRGGPPQRCTTQLVPGGFTEGVIYDEHYGELRQLAAPAAVIDSEVLHRGAATPPLLPAPAGAGAGVGEGEGNGEGNGLGAPLGAGWVSSCSVELCSSAGWEAWLARTGGTSADPADEAFQMLPIAAGS